MVGTPSLQTSHRQDGLLTPLSPPHHTTHYEEPANLGLPLTGIFNRLNLTANTDPDGSFSTAAQLGPNIG